METKNRFSLLLRVVIFVCIFLFALAVVGERLYDGLKLLSEAIDHNKHITSIIVKPEKP